MSKRISRSLCSPAVVEQSPFTGKKTSLSEGGPEGSGRWESCLKDEGELVWGPAFSANGAFVDALYGEREGRCSHLASLLDDPVLKREDDEFSLGTGGLRGVGRNVTTLCPESTLTPVVTKSASLGSP